MKKVTVKKTPAKKATVNKTSSPVMTAMDKQWQAESDVRTLMDAEKIKADKKRLSAAKAQAAKQAAAVSKVSKL